MLLLAVVALVAAGLVTACGDSGGDEDPQQVLDETFNADHSVNSGVIDLSVSGSAEGEGGGSFEASVNGPFQGGEEGEIPQFDLTASISGEDSEQSIDFSGGLIATSDAAFISYQDETYEVPGVFVSALQKLSEQAQKQAKNGSQEDAEGLLDQYGVEPENWLTNLTNEGDEDVEGTSTIHIHGDADVPQMLDDLQSIAQQAGEDTAELAPDETQQVEDAVEEASIDVYSGADDRILRKLDVNLALTAPEDSESGVDSVDVTFSVTLGEVNEDQNIEAPSDAKSFGELETQLGLPPGLLEQALGGGALGGGALGGGALGGGGSLDGGGSIEPQAGTADDKYLDCISKATTAEELQACEP
jgi:hypothetical protein